MLGRESERFVKLVSRCHVAMQSRISRNNGDARCHRPGQVHNAARDGRDGDSVDARTQGEGKLTGVNPAGGSPAVPAVPGSGQVYATEIEIQQRKLVQGDGRCVADNQTLRTRRNRTDPYPVLLLRLETVEGIRVDVRPWAEPAQLPAVQAALDLGVGRAGREDVGAQEVDG